jgi:poly(hydroxyalkanoate) depolymerase family esterase
MSRRLRHGAPALLSLATVLLEVSPSLAASWKTNVNYGGSTKMDLYVPDKPAASPPVLVALHYCSGSASNAHSWFQSYADMYGFVIIAPTAGGNCFDATPTRAGERAAIVSMVNYVVMQNSADTKRVFSVGASSGACMTQALLAAYPDVFAAGSSLAGVPAGAWTGGNTYAWSTSGVSGGQAWGDKVRAADPGFTGTRPRVQLWQGQGDTTLTYSQTYPAEVAQWTNVFGVTDSDGTMTSVKPPGAQDTWARTSYKDKTGTVVVEANSGPSNVPHDLTGRGLFADVIRFFGLDGTPTGPGGTGGTGAGGQSAGGSGGVSSSSGGKSAAGGTPGSGGTLGMAGTGVIGTGGTTSTGGTSTSTGGTSTSTGGTSTSTGGTSTSTGGTSTSTGGTTSTGGSSMTGTGGSTSTGGSSTTTGGSTSTGGSTTGTGGSHTTGGAPAGGKNATGGTKSTSNSGDDDSTGQKGGCSIGRSDDSRSGAAALALLLGLGGLFGRRRRR